MILRKPYAFLIKKFKRVHLFLLLLMSFVAYETNNLLSFFTSYIKTGLFERNFYSLSSTYINIYIYLAIIIIFVVSIAIYILMDQKNKPKRFYFIIMAFYIVLLIFFFAMSGVLDMLDMSGLDPSVTRAVHDIIMAFCVAQYAAIVLVATRALGFNVKKFNFGEDLANLQIEENDNEEFELNINLNARKIGRGFRKEKRELKYFIVENAFILTIAFLLVVIPTSIVIFFNYKANNIVYNQNDAFKTNNFIIKVNDCYFTHINQMGEDIASDGKEFAITRITFTNRDKLPHVINLANISLSRGDTDYDANITRYQSFVDLGNGYVDQTILAGATNTYIFVFEIDDKVSLNKLYFRYRDKVNTTFVSFKSKYKKVKLNGQNIDTIKLVSKASINETLSFKTSALNNSKLKIKDYQIGNSFIYDATTCYNGKCITNQSNLTLAYTTIDKLLMRLAIDYKKDAKLNIDKADNMADIIDTYGFFRYSIKNKEYNIKLLNKTPYNYKGTDLYYQVPYNIDQSKKIELILRIRNKEFVYKLK